MHQDARYAWNRELRIEANHSCNKLHATILESETKFWLIDFDKCGEKSGSFWKEGNLQRLQRSFNKEVERMHIQFDGQHWQHLMEGYSQK